MLITRQRSWEIPRGEIFSQADRAFCGGRDVQAPGIWIITSHLAPGLRSHGTELGSRQDKRPGSPYERDVSNLAARVPRRSPPGCVAVPAYSGPGSSYQELHVLPGRSFGFETDTGTLTSTAASMSEGPSEFPNQPQITGVHPPRLRRTYQGHLLRAGLGALPGVQLGYG